MLNLFNQTAAPIEAIGKVIDSLFTSDEERLDKKAALARIAQQPQLLQGEINKIEAAHKSTFVAGWRPFIGWVCGISLLYQFIFRDMIIWGIQIAALEVAEPPPLQIETLSTILYALLGLGGLRTFEKIQGKTK